MVQIGRGTAASGGSNFLDDRTAGSAKIWTKKAALWVAVWCAIALAIRLTNLTAKPPWMDEISTILFSMGNSSRLIPLNEIIGAGQLLRPLQVTPGSTAWDSARYLLAENNHPPAYFALAHSWMRLFPTADGYASLWGARSLSAIFGALGVPAIYLLAWASFRSRAIALLCAALMAVSPFDVFLSQEARHYTLAILTVIVSLSCFVLSVRAIAQGKAPSWWTTLGWVAINAFAISVHYFSGITILAEALTLLILLIRECRIDGSVWRKQRWIRIYVAAVGTFVGSVVWLPILLNFYGSPQSSFLRSGPASWKYWVDPIAQSVAGWLYAVLSPVTNGYGPVMIAIIVASCLLLLGVYSPWLIGRLARSLRVQIKQPDLQVGLQAIGGFFIISNIIFLLICYGLGFDITRGHRYSFVFFPSLLILVGAALAPYWQTDKPVLDRSLPQRFNQVKLPFVKRFISGKAFVATVIFVGFLGSQVIVNNLTNLKFYKADRFVNLIQTESQFPAIIGTYTTITEQPIVVGIEIMSVGWEVKNQIDAPDAAQRWPNPPQFVIAENNAAKSFEAETQLAKSLETVARPFDLWLLNMSPDLENEGCASPESGNKGSFSYAHYVCEQPPA